MYHFSFCWLCSFVADVSMLISVVMQNKCYRFFKGLVYNSYKVEEQNSVTRALGDLQSQGILCRTLITACFCGCISISFSDVFELHEVKGFFR